jgi:hypothetical protein
MQENTQECSSSIPCAFSSKDTGWILIKFIKSIMSLRLAEMNTYVVGNNNMEDAWICDVRITVM